MEPKMAEYVDQMLQKKLLESPAKKKENIERAAGYILSEMHAVSKHSLASPFPRAWREYKLSW